MFTLRDHFHNDNKISCFVISPYMNTNERMQGQNNRFKVLGLQDKSKMSHKMQSNCNACFGVNIRKKVVQGESKSTFIHLKLVTSLLFFNNIFETFDCKEKGTNYYGSSSRIQRWVMFLLPCKPLVQPICRRVVYPLIFTLSLVYTSTYSTTITTNVRNMFMSTLVFE